MDIKPTGARLDIRDGTEKCVVRASRPGPRLSAAMVTNAGQPDADIRIMHGDSPWELDMPPKGARSYVILYMSDDTEKGRVEDRGPITVEIGDTGFTLEERPDRHGAVILAEIYQHSGSTRARVRGDGYAFGIKALARKEGLPIEPFIPERERYEDTPRPGRGQSRPVPPGATGSGSGIIVARDHVITNAHVVRQTRTSMVHGPDGDVQGRVLAVDELHDLALLRTPGIGGCPIPIMPPGSICLGEAVIAAGYPLRDILGDDLKMTHGNVSGVKGWEGMVSAFQFSAPIGSGSSGGAVMDQNGNLVGVVTSALAHEAMRSMGAVSENVNFATKASLVVEMLAAHDVEWVKEVHTAGTPADVARRIRQSVVSITVS